MQGRTVAIPILFFVVVAIAAYSVAAVAGSPSVSVSGQTYSQGDSASIGNTTWTIYVYDGQGAVVSANESTRFDTIVENNSSVIAEDGTYWPGSNSDQKAVAAVSTGTNASKTRFVLLPNHSNTIGDNTTNTSSFVLRQQFNVSARLRTDSAVANTTLTAPNGTQYVRYRNRTVQSLDAYLPPPKTRTISVGDSFTYGGNATTVESVNSTGVALARNGTATHTQELREGANVTLAGTTYVTHFPDNDTVVLSRDVSNYRTQVEHVHRFHNRILGLWGVSAISLFATVLLIGVTYLPVRD